MGPLSQRKNVKKFSGLAGVALGAIVWATISPGAGWVLCNGQAFTPAAGFPLGANALGPPAAALVTTPSFTFPPVFGNGIWVGGAGSTSIYKSTDQVTWTIAYPGDGTITFGQAIFIGGKFYVTTSNGKVCTSTDGVSWTLSVGITGNVAITSICYGGGLFMVVTQGGASWTSADGSTWTSISSAITSFNVNRLIYAFGLFIQVGIGTTASPYYGAIWCSSNSGVTWTRKGTNTGANRFKSICYGNGILVAVGDIGSTTASQPLSTSTDGLNWTTLTVLNSPSPAAQVAFANVIFSKGLFIAVGAGSVIWSSTDGLNWTTVPSPVNTTLSFLGAFVIGATIVAYTASNTWTMPLAYAAPNIPLALIDPSGTPLQPFMKVA
jgi:hypothetical protein